MKIVLVRPQLSENIGATARAMLNFGLMQLTLVAPQPDWLNDTARALAAGADVILDNTQVVDTLAQAIAECTYVIGTTATPRDHVKPYAPINTLFTETPALTHASVAIVFGPERTGLTNEDLVPCHVVTRIPANPDFSSLNLAQAVLVTGYAYALARDCPGPMPMDPGPLGWATQAALDSFFTDLRQRLDLANHWHEEDKIPIMWQNLRNIFMRIPLTTQDIQTLRGVLRSLNQGATRQ